jgi:hypothetical protein
VNVAVALVWGGALVTVRDAVPLFESAPWACADAPVRDSSPALCSLPEVKNSAKGLGSVAIRCATAGCRAWATNARSTAQGDGRITLHVGARTFVVNGAPPGTWMRGTRFPFRVEDASSWFALRADSIYLLRTVERSPSTDECGLLVEVSYFVRADVSGLHLVAKGVTGVYAPQLTAEEVEEGFSGCLVRPRAIDSQCVILRDESARGRVTLRCGEAKEVISADHRARELRVGLQFRQFRYHE